jgi:hypothetical protein
MNGSRVAPCRRHRSSSRGQGLVEFALLFPLFFLLVVGIFDASRVVYMNSVVSQAAREGARLGVVEARYIGSDDPSCNAVGGPQCPAGFGAFKADVVAAANRMARPFGVITDGQVFISCDPAGSAPTGDWINNSCSSRTSGSILSVRVELTFSPITPIVAQSIPTMKVSGAATMVIY